jgi:hypothetical protein
MMGTMKAKADISSPCAGPTIGSFAEGLYEISLVNNS